MPFGGALADVGERPLRSRLSLDGADSSQPSTDSLKPLQDVSMKDSPEQNKPTQCRESPTGVHIHAPHSHTNTHDTQTDTNTHTHTQTQHLTRTHATTHIHTHAHKYTPTHTDKTLTHRHTDTPPTHTHAHTNGKTANTPKRFFLQLSAAHAKVNLCDGASV